MQLQNTPAIMSRFICVAVLLIILADNVFDSTASPVKSHGHKVRNASSKCMCMCREFPNGKIMCRSTLLPNNVEKQRLLKCNCKKPHTSGKLRRPSIPISLA